MLQFDGRIVAALYDAIADPSALQIALSTLAQRYGCQSASIVSFDPITPSASIAECIGAFDEGVRRQYETQFAAHDPAPAAYAAQRSGSAHASNRVFSRDYLRKSVMLHEFLQPLGIEETLGGTVSASGGRFAFLTVHRGRDRVPFDDPEILDLERMLPHVTRALELRRTFARLEIQAGLLGSVIDRLAAGVAVYGSEENAIHVNRAARAIAGRQDGIWLDRSGIVHAVNRDAERQLVALRADARSGGAGGVARVPRRGAGRPYAVLIAPAPSRFELDTKIGRRRGVFVLIHDPDAQTSGMSEAIAVIFELPPATAQFVAALARGEDGKSYAARHGITYEAIRYHLKTAYARTGVHNQARLLQLVTRALMEFNGRE